MSDPVIIVDYDPIWPRLFAAESERLAAALAPHTPLIEHVGSTAVPGLAAKPIIDIMIGLGDLGEADGYIPILVALGYTYVPEFETVMPERRYFRQGSPVTHHLHMVTTTSDFWQRHLAFRDHLRTHPADREAYGQLKRQLAVHFRHDRSGYSEAKSDFIRAIEAQAR